MSQHNKILYHNWIVDLGYNPGEINNNTDLRFPGTSEEIQDSEVREEVNKALNQLSGEEKELIVRYHFMGESFQQIAQRTGRAPHKLTARHGKILLKLKDMLAEYVERKYKIVSQNSFPGCPICESDKKEELDDLIAKRNKKKSWRPIMAVLKNKYGLTIRYPQILKSHEKYHMAGKLNAGEDQESE